MNSSQLWEFTNKVTKQYKVQVTTVFIPFYRRIFNCLSHNYTMCIRNSSHIYLAILCGVISAILCKILVKINYISYINNISYFVKLRMNKYSSQPFTIITVVYFQQCSLFTMSYYFQYHNSDLYDQNTNCNQPSLK